MSWKPVELQIAIPRTVENSRNQQIQQHQAVLQNELDGEEQARQTLRQEQTVVEVSEDARAEWRDRQGNNQTAADKRDPKKRSQSEETADAPHPYKGHRLDIKM